nr:SDR family NAD(P)-dependent oxidoreductase [Bacteroidota bacterium]
MSAYSWNNLNLTKNKFGKGIVYFEKYCSEESTQTKVTQVMEGKIKFMSRTKSLILGASSGVGRALSYYLTSLNQDIFLCSRGLRDLEAMASDISAKYSVQVNYKNIDLSNTAEVDDLFNSIDINDFSEIYITIGKVVSIDNGEQPFTTVSELMETNYIAPVRIINKIFQNYTQLKSLKILIISLLLRGKI